MKRVLAILALMGLLNGCVGGIIRPKQTIPIPVEKARATAATARTLYLAIYNRMAPACGTDAQPSRLGTFRLDDRLVPDCQRLREIHREFQRLDFEIRRALDNPGVEIDWARVEDILRLAADLLL